MRPAALALDSVGNFYVAHGDGRPAATAIWVFRPDGTFSHLLGREGQGPGEYRGIGRIDVLPGDTLVVYDQILRRRTTLSPQGEVLATQPLEVGAFFRSALLPGGALVVNEHMRTVERVGYPLQLLDRSGRVVKSFGSVEPEYRRGEEVRFWRLVVPTPDPTSVWSVGVGDYIMELWDTTGSRRKVLERKADWFRPFLHDRPITADGPAPLAWLRLASTDAAGRLYIVATAPADDWRDRARLNPGFATDLSDLFALYDWILEILDPASGALLVSERYGDREFSGFLGDSLVVTYREDNEGYPFLDVWRLSFSDPRDLPKPKE